MGWDEMHCIVYCGACLLASPFNVGGRGSVTFGLLEYAREALRCAAVRFILQPQGSTTTTTVATVTS